jgi:hypothetical protein
VPVVSMSKKEFDRLEVLLGVQSRRLRVCERLRSAQSEAAPGISVAGRVETRRRGQLGLEAARPAEQ